MPLVDTDITSDDIERVTQNLDLYETTWGRMQRAETREDLVNAADLHVLALEAELGGLTTMKTSPMPVGTSEGEAHVEESIYVHVADYDEPIPLLYFQYHAGTGDTFGGDIDLY